MAAKDPRDPDKSFGKDSSGPGARSRFRNCNTVGWEPEGPVREALAPRSGAALRAASGRRDLETRQPRARQAWRWVGYDGAPSKAHGHGEMRAPSAESSPGVATASVVLSHPDPPFASCMSV